MIPILETLFSLLLNALLQIGLFAVLAVVFSRLVAKTRARYQYSFYVAVLVFCLLAPAVNTFWHSTIMAVAERSQQQASSDSGGANRNLWSWTGHPKPYKQLTISHRYQRWILGLWVSLFLLRLIDFSRAVYRVHRLRRDASPVSLTDFGIASRIFGAKHRVTLLESAAIDDPVTVGLFCPTVLLPCRLLPGLGDEELSAILAHEYGHIRRRDFSVNFLCELISLPVAWHPGIRYLMSKISQTRELACDDYAAARLGKRRAYANALLHVASLSLHGSRHHSLALGIFEGDDLETRIKMLTEKRVPVSMSGFVGLVLALSTTFGADAVLAHAMSLQMHSDASSTADTFAGTWHWMFDGKSFATMTLIRSGSNFTGSVTESRIALKGDGSLLRADPSNNTKPKQITRAILEGSSLHVMVADGFQFTVTKKDDTHAEIHPLGAPQNMKPISAEKVR